MPYSLNVFTFLLLYDRILSGRREVKNTVKYEIKYSARKTLSICVKNSSVIVRAPFGTSNDIIEKALIANSAWIKKQIKKQMERKDRIPELTEAEILSLKKQAKSILKAKTEYFAKIMNLKYGRITITSAKIRFGSCSSQKNICYSYRLMLYPEKAIDYVVVHELAHTKEMNHSKAFYDIVASVLPDYKDRRKLLK